MKTCYVERVDNYTGAIADLVRHHDGYMITRVNVPYKHRRKGIGTKIMKRILEDADEQNVSLYLHVVSSGEMTDAELTKWYEKLGFKWHNALMHKRSPHVQGSTKAVQDVYIPIKIASRLKKARRGSG